NPTQTAYDTYRRVTKTTDGVGIETRYGYDANGNLQTVTTAAPNATTGPVYNVVTSFTYDLMNRLSVVQDPAGAGGTTTYDPAGLVASERNANGTLRTHGYDPRGLEVQAVNGVGLPCQCTAATWYDPAGLPVSQSGGTGAPYLKGYDPQGRSTRA